MGLELSSILNGCPILDRKTFAPSCVDYEDDAKGKECYAYGLIPVKKEDKEGDNQHSKPDS